MRSRRGGARVVSLVLGTALALGASDAAGAVIDFATTLGEEVATNGLWDPGESVTLDVQAVYAVGEAAVNYQVDLQLSGDLSDFSFTPVSPASFGAPGSATCAQPTPTLLRCFGNTDLIADSGSVVTDSSNPTSLGTVQIQALAGSEGSSLTVTPGPLFTEELINDPQNPGLKLGSPLSLTTSGLDGSGNAVDMTVSSLPPDSDGDGIADDGDGSGAAGDAPCSCTSPGVPAGCDAGCDDNCRYTANAGQEDVSGQTAGFGGTGPGPDGIGDVCQCGDMNADGAVNATDLVLYRRFFAGETSPFSQDLCSVTGAGGVCDASDVVIMRRTFAGIGPGISQVCTNQLP